MGQCCHWDTFPNFGAPVFRRTHFLQTVPCARAHFGSTLAPPKTPTVSALETIRRISWLSEMSVPAPTFPVTRRDLAVWPNDKFLE
jgi:hypothetical protein